MLILCLVKHSKMDSGDFKQTQTQTLFLVILLITLQSDGGGLQASSG